MIQPFISPFLSPTPAYRRLTVLSTLYKDPTISQHKLGKINNLSGSMVNNYIRELHQEGLISVNGSTNRSQSYHLTAAGMNELRETLSRYAEEISNIFTYVKEEQCKIKKLKALLPSHTTENRRVLPGENNDLAG